MTPEFLKESLDTIEGQIQTLKQQETGLEERIESAQEWIQKNRRLMLMCIGFIVMNGAFIVLGLTTPVVLELNFKNITLVMNGAAMLLNGYVLDRTRKYQTEAKSIHKEMTQRLTEKKDIINKAQSMTSRIREEIMDQER